MKAKKLLVVCGFAVAAVSANATITLANGGSFSLGGVFSSESSVPMYTANSSVSSINLGTPPSQGFGSLNQWWFSAVSTSGNLTTLTYSITLSGITSSTDVFGLIQGFSYDPSANQVGADNYITTPIFANVEAMTGSSAFTQTLNFTEDITSSATPAAFFEGNFQFANAVPEPTGVAALAIGALGLLVRRKRSK